MRTRTAISLGLALGLGLVSTARAEVVRHSSSGLQAEVPDSWTQEQEGDLLTVSSPTKDVVMFFFVARRNDVAEFIDGITEELDRWIKKAEITQEATEEEVNGLTQYYVEGTGEADGEPVDWDVTYVVGGRSALAVVAVGDIGTNQAVINGIYGSISR
jgi:hypothetical protein